MYEYKVVGIKNFNDREFKQYQEDTERYLNLLGKDGWELVSVDEGIAFLKKRKSGIVKA